MNIKNFNIVIDNDGEIYFDCIAKIENKEVPLMLDKKQFFDIIIKSNFSSDKKTNLLLFDKKKIESNNISIYN